MYLKRLISLKETLKIKSILLLGPRRTGKSWLIKNELKPDITFNLLEAEVLNQLALRPSVIKETVLAGKKLIAIDEVQKLPLLMDEVHSLIESYPQTRFILSGSSARKLRRQQGSLIAGRARTFHLKPFVSGELKKVKKWNLEERLLWGCLPPVVFSPNPAAELLDYTGDYLREEIAAEGASRKIEAFARFLKVAATCQGQIINFESVARDCQVPPRTVREYFYVLEDTLLGTLVPAFEGSGNRKATSRAKFYLFDTGVYHGIIGQNHITPSTTSYGLALESLVFQELSAWLSYHRDPRVLSYWRTYEGLEVDFIVNSPGEKDTVDLAIEVKATHMATPFDCKNFKIFSQEVKVKKKILVTQDRFERVLGDVDVMPVDVFLERLWANGF